MTKEELLAQHPDLTYLSAGDVAVAEAHLRCRKLIGSGETVVQLAEAGEGNMNCTLRARMAGRSLVLKQSRPWVEKYPQIAAPWDRVSSEARFYELTGSSGSVAKQMPRLVDFDPASRILVLEDLGDARDFTDVYPGGSLPDAVIGDLAIWLTALHGIVLDRPVRCGLENREMRALNCEHIFRLPLDRENGLDLDAITPGLRDVADQLSEDRDYVRQVQKLGELYLSDGPLLVHGDFFPGSWLKTDCGVYIIDPEFAFCGLPEFDIGVFLAHLQLANQGDRAARAMRQVYAPPDSFRWELAVQFAGVEMMRRLIGVAQLPLDAGMGRKKSLLERSRQMVLMPADHVPRAVPHERNSDEKTICREGP